MSCCPSGLLPLPWYKRKQQMENVNLDQSWTYTKKNKKVYIIESFHCSIIISVIISLWSTHNRNKGFTDFRTSSVTTEFHLLPSTSPILQSLPLPLHYSTLMVNKAEFEQGLMKRQLSLLGTTLGKCLQILRLLVFHSLDDFTYLCLLCLRKHETWNIQAVI